MAKGRGQSLGGAPPRDRDPGAGVRHDPLEREQGGGFGRFGPQEAGLGRPSRLIRLEIRAVPAFKCESDTIESRASSRGDAGQPAKVLRRQEDRRQELPGPKPPDLLSVQEVLSPPLLNPDAEDVPDFRGPISRQGCSDATCDDCGGGARRENIVDRRPAERDPAGKESYRLQEARLALAVVPHDQVEAGVELRRGPSEVPEVL